MSHLIDGGRRGFSVMEVGAIVVIVTVIAIIFVPRLSVSSDDVHRQVHAHNKAVINAAVEKWYIQKGVWPAEDLSDIGADPKFLPEGIPTNPIDGSIYRLNAKTHRVQ